ncbi:MAG TPA: hypothetical protein VNZ49_08135 [Bacteroidia bacterium]|jgi:hypothetical protein|nr:hypothetical protein [Bacteroidia bacterium]
MIRVLAIFLFSTLPAVLCAQNDDKKKNSAIKKPARFKVVKLNDPVPFLGKYTHNNEAQKSELVKADTLQIKYCFNLPSELRVYRFRLSAIVNGLYYSYTTRGGLLTREMKDLLDKTVNGTKIKISTVGYKKVKNDTVKTDFTDICIKVIDNTDTSLITYKLKHKIPEPGLFSVKNNCPLRLHVST